MPRQIVYRDLAKLTTTPNINNGTISTDVISVNQYIQYPNGFVLIMSDTSYTVLDSDVYIVVKETDVVLTLPQGNPSTGQNVGRLLYIICTDNHTVSSLNPVVIQPDGSGPSTDILFGTGKWVTLVCDGTNWDIIQYN